MSSVKWYSVIVAAMVAMVAIVLVALSVHFLTPTKTKVSSQTPTISVDVCKADVYSWPFCEGLPAQLSPEFRRWVLPEVDDTLRCAVPPLSSLVLKEDTPDTALFCDGGELTPNEFSVVFYAARRGHLDLKGRPNVFFLRLKNRVISVDMFWEDHRWYIYAWDYPRYHLLEKGDKIFFRSHV